MNPRSVLPVLLTLALALIAACADTATDDLAGSSGPRDGYPPGPYGTTADTVIANLQFTTAEGDPLSFEDLYADGDNRLLLISTAAGWCTSCREEQPKLQSLHAQHHARGLVVLLALFEDAAYATATAAEAARWKDRNSLTFDVVADEAFALSAYYDPMSTPMNMMVDVASMKILWLTTGWDQTTIDAIIQSRL